MLKHKFYGNEEDKGKLKDKGSIEVQLRKKRMIMLTVSCLICL